MGEYMNTKLIKRIVILVAGGAFVTTIFGVGCGNFSANKKVEFASNSSQGTGDLSGGGTTQDGQVIMAGVKSAGVPILAQAYSTLTSALQVTAPSATTRTAFTTQSTNFSDNGRPDTVSAAYAVAYQTLGAEVCRDRINIEINQAAAAKAVFTSINLNAAPANNISDANLSIVINRLARSLWQRNETDAERQILLTAVTESMALDTTNNAVKTQEAALFLCTAMLASSSGMSL